MSSILPQDPDSNTSPPRECENSIDVTPGVVWTDSQLAVVRQMTARLVAAEAAVRRVEAVATELDRKGDDLWSAYKTAPPSDPRRANPLVEGQVDAFDEAYELVRRALAGDA